MVVGSTPTIGPTIKESNMTKGLIKRQPKKIQQLKKSTSKEGKISKTSATFLAIMKEEFGFEPAKEFIELYSNEQYLYQELYLRFTNKNKRRRMSILDINTFWKLHAELKDTLKTFIKYSYPTLRTMDMKGDGGSRPIFNINLGVPPEPKMKNVSPTIDITEGDQDGSI
jgi:hypothetical protein